MRGRGVEGTNNACSLELLYTYPAAVSHPACCVPHARKPDLLFDCPLLLLPPSPPTYTRKPYFTASDLIPVARPNGKCSLDLSRLEGGKKPETIQEVSHQ